MPDHGEVNDSNKVSLKYIHALGFRGNGSGSSVIQHLDDDERILYLVGHHVAVYNYEKRTHQFFLKSSKTARINFFSLSFNQKYIMLAESVVKKIVIVENDVQMSRNAVIHQLAIYDFKKAVKHKVLSFGEREIKGINWSKDCKYFVVALSNEVILYAMEKMKKLATKSYNHSLDTISMNPFAHWQIASTGTEDLKIWRFTENELRSFDPIFGNNKTGGSERKSAMSSSLNSIAASDNQTTSSSKRYSFTCHVWFDDEKLLVGTEEGIILLIDGLQVVKEIHDIHPMQGAQGILCIASVDRGFICAGEGGYLSVFERTYDAEYFNHYKRFRGATIRKESIIGICVSKKEDSVIVVYEDNQIAYFPLANVDILKENANDNFVPLPISFHDYPFFNKATGMNTAAKQPVSQQLPVAAICTDTCIQKTLLASVCNRSVRIYNYRRRAVELTSNFSEEVLSVSLCPTGFRIVIGFRFKLCLYNIERDKLSLVCTWQLKSVSLVQFHGSGDKFFAVTSTNILIISALNFKVLKTLRGHSGIVKSAQWSRLENDCTGYDYRLVSVGHEGSKYEWTIVNPITIGYIDFMTQQVEKASEATYPNALALQKSSQVLGTGKVSETIIKSCAFRSCDFDGELNLVTAVGSDRRIYSFRGMHVFSEIRLDEYDLTCIRISITNKCYFVGTACGKVLIGSWPPMHPPYATYELHLASVCCLGVSTDGQQLFSMGTDGSLFIMSIRSNMDELGLVGRSADFSSEVGELDYQANLLLQSTSDQFAGLANSQKKQDNFDYTLMQDLYIVHGPTLEELETNLANITLRLSQLKLENDREKEKIYYENEEKLKQEKRIFAEELRHAKMKSEELKQRMLDEQMAAKERYIRLEQIKTKSEQAYQETLQKIEKQAELEKQMLADEKDESISNLADVVFKLKAVHDEELAKLKEDYENDKLTQNQMLEELGVAYTKLNDTFEITSKFNEEDFESELSRAKTQLHEQLKVQKKQVSEERGKAATNMNTIHVLNKQLRTIEKQRKDTEKSKVRTQKQLDEAESQIKKLLQENMEKHERIAVHEKKVTELKKQAEELEKLRYVLTFKFNRLSKEVGPKEDLIKELRDELKAKDDELQKVKIAMDGLHSQVSDRNQKLEVLKNQLMQYRQDYEDKNRVLELLISNLSTLASKGDYKATNQELKNLVRLYSNLLKKGADEEKNVQNNVREFDRQRQFLETQMTSVKKALEHKERHTKHDMVRKNYENSALVEEINELRKELKRQKQRTNILEIQLKNAQQAAHDDNAHYDDNITDRRPSTSASTNRPSTAGSSRSRSTARSNVTKSSSVITRIRTPDSFFSTPSARSSFSVVSGSRLSKSASSGVFEKAKVQEFLDTIEGMN